MGHVLPVHLGLGDVRRADQIVSCALFFVHPLPAHDFDFRDADPCAGNRGPMSTSAPIYGLLAEFDTPDALMNAVRQARAAGYRRMDAYTPFPVEHLAEELGFHNTVLPLVVLIGGLIGCAGGYLLQYWISVVDYPANIGCRPLHS